MSTKTKITGLIVALMALSVPFVYADTGMGDKDSHQEGDWHHGKGEHMTAKILNLTDDQVKQMEALRQKRKESMKGTFEQIMSNREALNTEIIKATPDMNKINDFQNQLKAMQAQMADDHLNSILAIKKIMTPEQFIGYMALEKEEMLMKHKGHGSFGHKDGIGKEGDD